MIKALRATLKFMIQIGDKIGNERGLDQYVNNLALKSVDVVVLPCSPC
jgi:hypothetical protein